MGYFKRVKQQIRDEVLTIAKDGNANVTGSYCCQENHVIISMIQTEDLTFLKILNLPPPPTIS